MNIYQPTTTSTPKQLKAIYLFFISTLLFPTTFCYTQSYRFNNYAEKDGLCCTPVTNIYKDKKGFLWISTINGINRFDGHDFKKFPRNPGDDNSLLGGEPRNMCEDEAGKFWINDGYLGVFDPESGKIQHCINPATKKYIHIWHMMLYDEKTILLSYDHQLNAYNKQTGEITKIDSFHYINSVYKGENGTVWVNYANGLCNYNIYTHSIIFETSSLGISGNSTSSIIDHNGNLWITQWNNGFYKVNISTKKVKHYTKTKQLATDIVFPFLDNTFTQIEEMADGHLWVSDYNTAIVDFDPINETFTNIVNNPMNEHAVPKQRVYHLFKDREGIVWIGGSAGISKMNPPDQFLATQYLPILKGGGAGGEILSVFQDNNNQTWFGTYIGLFVHQHASNTTQYINPQIAFLKKDFMEESFYCMESDHQGGFYTGGHHLIHFSQIDTLPKNKIKFKWDTIAQPIGKRFNGAFSLLHQGNTLWIGTNNQGLLKYNLLTKKYTHFPRSASKENTLPFAAVINIFSDHQGKIWLGTTFGLCTLDTLTGTIQRIYLDGNEDMVQSNLSYINTIQEDNYGRIWVGTRYGGLWVMDTLGKWRTANAYRPFEPVCVWKIIKDKQGKFWMNTGNGLCLYDPATYNAVFIKQADGLINTPELGDMFLNTEGRLVVGDQAALQIVTTPLVTFPIEKPVPQIVAVYAFDEKLHVPSNNFIDLPYEKNQLRIEYTGILFNNASTIQYQYKLEGFDKNWNNAEGRSFATYTNLPEGNYAFWVKANNGFGVWSASAARLDITIRTPWFRTWWLYSLVVLSVIGVIFIIYQYRIAQIHKIYKVRNHIATDLHDEIGSTLSSISINSQLAENNIGNNRATLQVLQQISSNSLHMLESMSDIVWSIHSSNDLLENIIIRMRQFAAETLEPKAIDVDFRITDLSKIALSMELRKNLYLIFKEAINNIGKYAKCDTVFIEIYCKHRQITMVITDNGIGFVENGTTSLGGNGIRNMRRRALESKGTLDITTKMNIGTSITFTAPM